MNKDSLLVGTKYLFQTRKSEPYRRGIYLGLADDGRLIFKEGEHSILVKSGHYVYKVSEDTTEERVNDALTQADFLARAKELEIVVLLLNSFDIHAGIGAIAPRGTDAAEVSIFIPYADAHRLGDLVRDAFFADYAQPKDKTS